jgi:hypothetical protein
VICCAPRGIIQYFAHGLLYTDTTKIIQSMTFAQVSLLNSVMTKKMPKCIRLTGGFCVLFQVSKLSCSCEECLALPVSWLPNQKSKHVLKASGCDKVPLL